MINAVVRGYISFQELLYYLTYVNRFQPDIIVSFNGFNDAQDSLYEAVFKGDDKQPLKTHRYREIESIVNDMMRKENNAQIIPVLVNKFRDLNTVKLIEAVIAKLKLRKDNGAGVLAAIDYENIPELDQVSFLALHFFKIFLHVRSLR
ncbi:MAG: hypothetical protein FVQ85_04075 [Planctomycetes bacterium]|nr:hypothetical protein [Planctomycetota bacterium]